MPDFSAEASHLHWKQYPDPMIHRVVSFMESVETWIKDGDPQLEQAMVQLGQVCDNPEKANLDQPDQQKLLIRLGNHLSMARILHIMHALDTMHPGSAAKLLAHADQLRNDDPNNAEVDLFLRRNMTFERLRLLARIFSSERMALVLKVLETE